MFLSKKNAVYFNKPKFIDPLKPKRILSGWEDEQEDKKDKYAFTSQKVQDKPPLSNLLQGDQFTDLTAQAPPKKQGAQKFYLDWDELNEKNDIQCQKRLVEEIVQPGGIRIKPNETMLSQFLKEVKGMEVHTIGSLLLSKLEVNYPFQTKAKALYTIEFLAKKNEVYLSYFKAHVDRLKQFPQPEDNVDNYRKILKSVLNVIGVSVSLVPGPSEETKPLFVDPGYNDDPKAQVSSFIQQNANKAKKSENKKVIIGPGMTKPKITTEKKEDKNDDIFSLDLLGGANAQAPKTNNNFNLLDQGQSGQMSFQDMLGGINLGQPAAKSASNNNFLI